MTIIGAKGHARGLIEVLLANGLAQDEVFLFDDVSEDMPDLVYGRYPVIRSLAQLQAHFSEHGRDFVLGLGGTSRRRDLSENIKAVGGCLTGLIAKSAQVSPHILGIADGACVLGNAIVGVDVEIGEGTLVNLAAVVAHDAKVGDYCDIAPGAKILGRAVIGDLTEIGANAVVLPGVKVGPGCRVGAGAVVNRDVASGLTVVGTPAKPVTRSRR